MCIAVENKLERRLGYLPVLMWDSSLLPEGLVFLLDFYLIIYLIDSSMGNFFFVGRGHFWIEVWTQVGTEKGLCITDTDLVGLGCLIQGHQRLKHRHKTQSEQKPRVGAGALELGVKDGGGRL